MPNIFFESDWSSDITQLLYSTYFVVIQKKIIVKTWKIPLSLKLPLSMYNAISKIFRLYI